MPTALTRIQVTQTPPVARALEIAEREWPGIPRAELIVRLLNRGAAAIEAAADDVRGTRRRALEQSRGSVAYPPGFLENLRQDWPE